MARLIALDLEALGADPRPVATLPICSEMPTLVGGLEAQ